MAIGSSLAYPLDNETGDTARLRLPCPAQTTGSGDGGGGGVEHRGMRWIDPEESAEFRVGEPGGGRFGVIYVKLGLCHLGAKRTQVGQHGVEELTGVPRPWITPAMGEGAADGR